MVLQYIPILATISWPRWFCSLLLILTIQTCKKTKDYVIDILNQLLELLPLNCHMCKNIFISILCFFQLFIASFACHPVNVEIPFEDIGIFHRGMIIILTLILRMILLEFVNAFKLISDLDCAIAGCKNFINKERHLSQL